MDITIRDLIQYLLLHTDLDDVLYSVDIIPDKHNDYYEYIGYYDVEKWKAGVGECK